MTIIHIAAHPLRDIILYLYYITFILLYIYVYFILYYIFIILYIDRAAHPLSMGWGTGGAYVGEPGGRRLGNRRGCATEHCL